MTSPYTIGQNFTPSDSVSFPPSRAIIVNGSGATATLAVSFSGVKPAHARAVLNADGSIASVTILDGGLGYTAAPTVSITGPNGTGATFTATVSGGKVTAIAVDDAGSGYVNPEIAITVDNTASVILPIITSEILELSITRVWSTGTASVTSVTVLY